MAALAVVVGLAIFFMTRSDSAEPYEPRPLTGDLAEAMDFTNVETAEFAEPYVPGPAAPTAVDAVKRFVDAEVALDFEAGFDLLAAEDRERFRSPQNWETAHQTLPILTSTEEPVPAAEDTFATSVTMEPGLDLIDGAVPGRATITWQPVAEDDGWRIGYSDSTIVPTFPDVADIPAAVTKWVELASECADTSTVELPSGRFVTSEVGRSRLCEATAENAGEVELGEVEDFDELDNPEDYLNAFGGDAPDYVYAVDVRNPAETRVIVAPLGDTWLVVDSLPSP